MASEPGYDKAKEVTPKTSDESGEEREKAQHSKVASNATEVLPGCIDVMSPYFLHASDAPGHIYVTEILRDGNYGEWVNDMRDALFAKNKMGFVDGSLSTPTPDSPYLQQWMRCNAMVKGWLKSAMDRDMRNSIRYANTARDIWVDLEERFGKGSAPRAFEIRRAVVLLRQEKASISSYYTKLKSLWDEMMAISPLPKCVCSGCTCNISKQMADMKEKEQLYDFLMGLDEEFTAVKSQILCSKPMSSLGRAYHMVSKDEQQRQVSATHKPMVEATAFQTQKVFNEKDGRGRRRDKPTYEEKFKHGGASATPSVNMASKIDKRNTWVIDSGATDHIVCDSNLLNRVELESGDFPVTIPNGDRVAAQEANNGSTEHNQLEVENDCTTPIETSELVDIHATENHEPVEPPVPTHNVQQQHRSQRTRSMPKYLENYETTLPPSLGPTPSTHLSASSTRRRSALAVAESTAWAIFKYNQFCSRRFGVQRQRFWSAATISGSDLRSKFSGQRALVPFLNLLCC
nr:uncharacterized protein LOC109163537 [Ipomoea trifida]